MNVWTAEVIWFVERFGAPTLTLIAPPPTPAVTPPKVSVTPGMALVTVLDGELGCGVPLIEYRALTPGVAEPCSAIAPALSETVKLEGAPVVRSEKTMLPLTTVPHTEPLPSALIALTRSCEVALAARL